MPEANINRALIFMFYIHLNLLLNNIFGGFWSFKEVILNHISTNLKPILLVLNIASNKALKPITYDLLLPVILTFRIY